MTSMLSAPDSYPAALESRPPVRFSRMGVAYRLLILMALGILHQSGGGLLGALYVILPILAGILVARYGSDRYSTETARTLVPVLDWVVAFYAYLFFVTDEFPLGASERAAHLSIRPEAHPTLASALLRLVTTLPHALVLAVLGVLSAFVGLAAAVAILATEQCPEALCTFQRGVVAWIARVLAYHASLVDAYPPFSL